MQGKNLFSNILYLLSVYNIKIKNYKNIIIFYTRNIAVIVFIEILRDEAKF